MLYDLSEERMFLFIAILLAIMLVLRLFKSSKPASSIPQEPRSRSAGHKSQEKCGRVTLTDLARTHHAFRSWCLSKELVDDKLAKFEKFKDLLLPHEPKLVYDFFEKGGETPSWIRLASLPIVPSLCSQTAQRAATKTLIEPIYPKHGSWGYLKTKNINSLFTTNDKEMALKKPNVESITTQAYYVNGKWIVFHPFHEHCKRIHIADEHLFVNIDIPINVLRDKDLWD